MGPDHSLLQAVAEQLLLMRPAHPLRVAIDGRTASGKTTFADALADILRRSQRPVIRASIDGFHHPATVRHRQGRFSPDGYYEDARDFAAMRSRLLGPLGPSGDRSYETRTFDLERDRPVRTRSHRAADDAILLVDGTFLQRSELEGAWDFVIFLNVSQEEARRRGVSRDQSILGGQAAATELYLRRYGPAFERYEAECSPAERAHVIVENPARS